MDAARSGDPPDSAGQLAGRAESGAAAGGSDRGGAGAAVCAAAAPPRPPRPPPTTTAAVPATYGTVFTNAKAGMQGVDLDRVKRVTYEASVGSAHFLNEQRKEAELAARLDRLAARAAALPPAQVAAATAATDARVAELLARRDRGRVWVVIDMDCFFAAVEAKDDPALAGTAFAVGSAAMVSTASYEARAHGVRSAMPGFVALKLLPSLRFVPPRFDRYVAEAKAVRAVLARFDPAFHAAGLDEAYLDLTAYCAEHGKAGLAAAHDVRAAIRAATGLAASAGVGPNRLCAKVAVDWGGKPDGAFAVPSDPAALSAWVAALPVRKVPGIGRVAERTLGCLGVKTCGELHAARGLVALLFSRASADFFLAAGVGAGADEGDEAPPAHAGDEAGRRGMSAERTFAPTRHRGELEAWVRSLAARLARQAAREGLAPRTLTLKVKLASFEVRSRAVGLSGAAVSAAQAAAAAAAAAAEGGGGGGGGRDGDGGQAHASDDDDEAVAPTPPAVAAAAAALEAAALRLLRAEPVDDVRLLGLRLSNWAPRGPPPGQRALDGLLPPAKALGGPGRGGDEEGGGPRPPPPRPSPPKPAAPAVAAAWTCGLCTFAGTPSHSLRCGVCDAVKGARPGDLLASAGAGAGGGAAPPAPAAKKAKKGGGAGAGGSGRTKPLAALFARRADC